MQCYATFSLTKWSVIFLCCFGFMASIKPGEPFITPYLLSPEKNFTREQPESGHNGHN
uniref:Solute carrier family 19 member 1 n=1 Tax=Myripristis murdjan TaxID=586833 RepID=A0A667WLU5_9TELE